MRLSKLSSKSWILMGVLLPVVILSLITWTINPHACCPDAFQVKDEPAMVQMESDTYCSTTEPDTSHKYGQFLRNSTQLDDTAMTDGQLLQFSAGYIYPVPPPTKDWDSVGLKGQVEPEAVFPFLIKHPPRI